MTTLRAKRLQRFYQRRRHALFTYALAITRDRGRAEDALHNAFANVLRLGALPLRLEPYMYRAVRNEALQELRYAAREPATDALFDTSVNGHPHDLEDLLNEAFKILRDAEREVVVLRELSGLSFREIGAVHGVPLSTAASWYRRAMAKLKSRIEELEHETT